MSNNKQQTAIQKFWDKIALKLSVEQVEEFIPLLKESKEMDKEQTKSRAVESYYLYTQYLEQIPKVGGATVEMDFEQYYEQTYGGNK